MKLYSDSDIQDIADAIRSKNGSSDTYKVSQMATAISNIPSGGTVPVWATNINDCDTIIGHYSGSLYDARGYKSNYSGSMYAVSLYTDSRSNYKKWYPSANISDSDIGDSVLDHLSSQTSSSYSAMFYMTSLASGGTTTPAPTTFTMDVVYKYKSVTTASNGTGAIGKPIVVDKDGKIIAVYSSWSSVVTALNNHTIDMSNGICVLCAGNSTSATSGSYYRIQFVL